MKWSNPSPKVQNILIAPIAIPAVIVLLPPILLAVGGEKLINWFLARQEARGWRPWFAWRPVYCGHRWSDTPRKWVWLETICRHDWRDGDTEYRWPEQVPNHLTKGTTDD
jgi:hypothetical protein